MPGLPPGSEVVTEGGGMASMFSSFFGGEPTPVPAMVTTQDFSEDAFQPPPLPKEFTDSFKQQ